MGNPLSSKQVPAFILHRTEDPSQLVFHLQGDGVREKTNKGDGILEEADGGDSIFIKFYSHLTLLNILYFGGALLVMGAYTLFMTLAYENCSHMGLSVVMLAQVVAFGLGGIITWQYNMEFRFVGGL